MDKLLERLKLRTIIFSDNFKENMKDLDFKNYVDSDDFYLELIDFSKDEMYYVTDYLLKKNIRDILFYLRSKRDISTLNDIVVRLNSIDESSCDEFYKTQYLQRADLYKDNKFSIKLNPEIFSLNEIRNDIKYSISLDYDHMNVLLNLNDEDFLENISFLASDFFVNTINYISYIDNEILTQDKIKERLKLVIKYAKEVYKSDKTFTTLEYFRVKKILKKTKK